MDTIITQTINSMQSFVHIGKLKDFSRNVYYIDVVYNVVDGTIIDPSTNGNIYLAIQDNLSFLQNNYDKHYIKEIGKNKVHYNIVSPISNIWVNQDVDDVILYDNGLYNKVFLNVIIFFINNDNKRIDDTLIESIQTI